MNCPGCGSFVSNGVTKCPYCGSPISAQQSSSPAENVYSSSSAGRTAQSYFDRATKITQKDHGVDVYDDNVDGVLEITWNPSMFTMSSGSGFLISKDGYALTNTHVVTHENGKSCERVNVNINGRKTTATVIALGDDKHGMGGGVDLALIKLDRVPMGVKVLKFEKTNNVRNGERVFVIGNSLGHGTCITSRIVSDKERTIETWGSMLMTDCPINGGNSGGPIFNDQGLVIGVIAAGITGAEGMNYAVPLNRVRDFLNKVSKIRI